MGAWDAVRYGWGVVYWLTVEGIPVVFAERALGLTLPTGYEAEDGSLVIDDSSEIGSEVDRRRGVSAGLSLGFRLLDTATVRGYIAAPSLTATLSLDVNATQNTVDVVSTSGWPNAGRFWLGHELISYTGKTATRFTGCARAIVGLPYKHTTASVGNVATDKPRWWRGRMVTLYATPVDPAGKASGATLATDAVTVWRGKVSDGPVRGMSWWDFQADALERVLDRPLAAKLSGKVVPTAKVYLVDVALGMEFSAVARLVTGAITWQYTFNLKPFAGQTAGTYLSGEEMRQLITTAWSAAVTAANASAKLGAMSWLPTSIKVQETWKSTKTYTGFAPGVQFSADANVWKLTYYLRWMGSISAEIDNETEGIFGTNGLPAGVLYFQWLGADNPLQSAYSTGPTSLTVALDSGLDALVPTKGTLRMTPQTDGASPMLLDYSARTIGPAGIVFAQLHPHGQPSAYIQITSEEFVGAPVEILFADEGNPDGCALRLLHSSGTGLRSAAWDALSEGQGYGLDDDYVDDDSFTGLLGAGGCGQLGVRVSAAAASFADLFGGLLALSRMAIASRQVNGQLKLAVVRTDAIGADYWTTITDADLLSISDQPVQPQPRLTPLNRITVSRTPYTEDGEGSEDKAVFSDIPAILALGEEGLDAAIPCVDNTQLVEYAYPLAVTTFASDQTAQAVTLWVPPWVDAEVGDLVKLNLTHPALWDYTANAPGYVGTGRVLGRTMEPRTMRVKLTVLINSSIKTYSLAPSARVLGWGGAANNPTTIDIGPEYLTRFQAAIAVAGWCWLWHYKPGQTETSATKLAVSAAVLNGGNTRLTVINWSGGTLSLGEGSRIAFPWTNDSNDYHKQFTHNGDLSVWS
jgi:hypothetical protein